jgi:hypothetical protein
LETKVAVPVAPAAMATAAIAPHLIMIAFLREWLTFFCCLKRSAMEQAQPQCWPPDGSLPVRGANMSLTYGTRDASFSDNTLLLGCGERVPQQLPCDGLCSPFSEA